MVFSPNCMTGRLNFQTSSAIFFFSRNSKNSKQFKLVIRGNTSSKFDQLQHEKENTTSIMVKLIEVTLILAFTY